MTGNVPRVDFGFKVRNTFKLTVRKASDGRIVRESGLSGNIVTKGGLNRMLSNPSNFTCGAVCGDGNAPPTINDSALESFVAGTREFDTGLSTTIDWAYKTDAPPIWCRQRRTWRFGLGEAEGNISEVGLAMASGVPNAVSPLFSRALVLDSGGNPTVIPVLADEYLDVTYDYYVYPQFNDAGSMPFEILGVEEGRDYILRAASMTGAWAWGGVSISGGTFLPFLPNASGSSTRAYSGAIGPVTGEPGNPIGNILSASLEDYVEDSFEREFSLSLALNQGNHANGLRSVACAMYMGRFQIEYDPPIPKTDEHVLQLDFRASVANVT